MTSQPQSNQPVDTNITHGNVSLIRQRISNNSEDVTSTKNIPAGATRVLPPAVAPRPKQSKKVHNILYVYVCLCVCYIYVNICIKSAKLFLQHNSDHEMNILSIFDSETHKLKNFFLIGLYL